MDSLLIFTATYDDGSQLQGGLLDGSFSLIDMSRLVTYSVTLDTFTVTLDITTGVFTVGEDCMRAPQTPPALRLISYATKQGDGTREWVSAFVVGWQSTVIVDSKPKNVRFGIKADLMVGRWDFTEAI